MPELFRQGKFDEKGNRSVTGGLLGKGGTVLVAQPMILIYEIRGDALLSQK